METEDTVSPGVVSAQEALIIPIGRPQYPVAAEAFISSLAWRVLSAEPRGGSPTKGFVYRSIATPPSGVVETFPRGEAVGALGKLLEDQGFVLESNDSALLGEAVANSILGILPTSAKSHPASPFTPTLALLQDLGGLLRTPRPPDLGKILDSLFQLGAGPEGSQVQCSELWYEASKVRIEHDSLLDGVNSAFGGLWFERAPTRGAVEVPSVSKFWQNRLRSTPFGWFYDKWTLLTDAEWVLAVPPRVWLDWASTVLRMAVGMIYLWEAAWYEGLARHVLSTDPISYPSVLETRHRPMIWHPSSHPPSMRDVGRALRQRTDRGFVIRRELDDWLRRDSRANMSPNEALNAMRQDDELLNAFIGASSVEGDPAKNTREAIQYSLTSRESDPSHADYYGLLRRRRPRYLVPDPGTEWIAVMASLACGKPNHETNVGRLLGDLEQLGIRPDLPDAVALLERAGMARGSADADQGVLIRSAY